jgi:hypothetical protein
LAPETAFDAALKWLFPDVSNKDIATRLQLRANRTTLANWRAGRRGIPRYALDRVRIELLQRFTPLNHALANAKERPGLKAGAKNLAKWRASRNRDNT